MTYKKILIAAGGTGGHIFPAIAIAQAFQEIDPNIQILFVGVKNKMEMEKVPHAGFKIEGIDMVGYNRKHLLKNLSLPFKLIKSYFQVTKIFNQFNPDAVVGFGGYVTYPVLRFAQQKGIPTFVHESNSYAGKANKLLGFKAKYIFVAYEKMDKFFPLHKILYTGNPIRKNLFLQGLTQDQAKTYFHLDPFKKTVLVMGGSLGAKNINNTIAENLAIFQQHNIQLIWQTGKVGAAEYQRQAKPYDNIFCSEFITEMQYAYVAADIAVSRAGAMAVTELCSVEIPTIFIPLPHAAEDHQTENAKYLVDKNAALLVKDQAAKHELVPTILALIKNENEQALFKTQMQKLSIKNADKKIAQYILNYDVL